MRDALPDAREPYVGHSFPQQASYPMYQAFYDGEQEVGRKVRGVVDLGKRALPVSKERGNPGTNNFDRVDGVDVEDSVYNIEEVEPYTGPQKDQPTQADWVLNLGMDSNRADIAREINELGLDSASDIYSQSNESDDGNKSLYAESVFSQESTQSSATGVSAVSGYSDAEIMTATKQLVSIFLEDTTSNQLYQRAFDHPRIGSDRLQRNLHRLLKTYSQNLHHEAQGELERLASQLVAVKARYVAQCVMEEFQVKPTVKRQRQNEAKADDSDQEEAEEEDKIPPIDEDRFEDIAVLRQFLVGSAAFGTFQEQLKSFVQPKSSHLPPMFLDEENHKTESTPPAMQPTCLNHDFRLFYLNKGHRAQVRHHRTCCTSGCECIPPQVKVVKPPMGSGEYDCNPSGPPDTWPPLCPEFMMHMLYSPDCIAEDDAYVLGQLPKKIDGKLEEVIDTPPEGWGLYFQEDVDISTIIGVIFMILFLTSLLFLILWTVLKDDIQGGSGYAGDMGCNEE
ncbi:hypothetical protein N0V95_000776 [Ascochyta clinopodiicola]|nr:hypothetical protein N0V95_000776 [Ascochyta clinopodiicola]